jgi:hypothetical protein
MYDNPASLSRYAKPIVRFARLQAGSLQYKVTKPFRN